MTEILEIEEKSVRPWSNWDSPKVREFTLNELLVENKDGVLELRTPDKTVDGTTTKGVKLGRIDNEAVLSSLGLYTGFPADFVGKLSPQNRAEVIAERLGLAGERTFQSVTMGNSVISLANSKRDILDAKKVADMAYDTLRNSFNELTIERAQHGAGLDLRLLTPRNDEITRREGDILNYGVHVNYTFGNEIAISLFSNRLWCANGAYHTESQFSWRSNDNKTEQAQLQFVVNAIESIQGRMDEVTERSRKMAETKFDGNWQDALRVRMQAMRIPQVHQQRVLDQFAAEPGDTEWHLLNAITRFASHAEGLTDTFRRNVQTSSGQWAAEFDLVNCRMPRALAQRVHATIIEG